jgi:hypothetical protein
LLAGIFGSAFVPAAMAASVKASYTEVYQGSEIAPFANDNDYNLGRTIGFHSADSSVEDGTAEFTSVQIALFETTEKAENAQDTGDGGAIDGKRYGATNYDPERLVATSSNDDILVSWAVDADGNAADCDDADLAPSVSPRGVLLGGTFGASDTLYDANGVDEYAASITQGYIDAAGDFSELDADDSGVDDTTDAFELCLTALNNDTAATSTVTVKADGTTVATLTVTAVGPADSIVLALAGSKYIAADNESVEDFLSIKVLDENKTVINGKASSVSSEDVDDIFGNLGINDYEGNPENANDSVVNLLNVLGDTTPSATDYTGSEPYLFNLSSSVCSSDEDEDMIGKSYSVRVEDEDQDFLSNAISITCTESGEDARVTKVTPEATTGGLIYTEAGYDTGDDDGVLMLVATVVSGNGGILGEGSDISCSDFDWSIDFATESFEDDSYIEEDEGGDIIGGECELGYIVPGDTDGDELGETNGDDDGLERLGLWSYTVTANESDLAEPGTDKDFALAYRATGTVDTVTIARVRNAAKTVATITFDGGESAAYESVYFQVEKANGAVVEYRRRANGDGIARLVLSRRNTTIYVYAFAETGDESDTIKVTFK